MARTNKSQFAILGCLTVRPMSAYEIKQFIARSVSFFWTEGEAQLYPTLKNLSEKKWVNYHEEAASKAGKKKIYKITEQGESALLKWLNETTERSVYRNELLLKIFFGSNQSTDRNITLIESSRSECETNLTLLLSIKNTLRDKNITEKSLLFFEITLDYGIDLLKAEINWAKKAIKRLKESSF